MSVLLEENAAEALAALGNRTRLRLLRLLVKAGCGGLNVGDLQSRLGVPASTLAHHLAALAHAGLIVQNKQGREVINSADFDAVKRLGAFLLDECCRGLDGDEFDNVA